MIGRIAADQVFFVHTDRSEVNGALASSQGMGKKQHLAPASDQVLGGGDGRIGRDSQDDGVESAALSEAAELLFVREDIAQKEPASSKMAGDLEFWLHQVARCHLHAAQSQKLGEHKPDR